MALPGWVSLAFPAGAAAAKHWGLWNGLTNVFCPDMTAVPRPNFLFEVNPDLLYRRKLSQLWVLVQSGCSVQRRRKNKKASRRCWTLDFWCWLRVHVCVLLTGNFPPCHTEVGSIDSVFIQGEAGRVTFPPNTAQRHVCHKHLRRTGLIKRHTWHAFRGRRFSSFHSSVRWLTSYNWTYFRHLLGWSECTVQDFILQYCKNRVCTSSNEL